MSSRFMAPTGSSKTRVADTSAKAAVGRKVANRSAADIGRFSKKQREEPSFASPKQEGIEDLLGTYGTPDSMKKPEASDEEYDVGDEEYEVGDEDGRGGGAEAHEVHSDGAGTEEEGAEGQEEDEAGGYEDDGVYDDDEAGGDEHGASGEYEEGGEEEDYDDEEGEEDGGGGWGGGEGGRGGSPARSEAASEAASEAPSSASSRITSSSRTDALYEHAHWKERKLQEKRAAEHAKHSFQPFSHRKPNAGYRAPAAVSQANRLPVHERLYAASEKIRARSLMSKRREMEETLNGRFTKSKKSGYGKLENRLGPALAAEDKDYGDDGVYDDDAASSVAGSARSAPGGGGRARSASFGGGGGGGWAATIQEKRRGTGSVSGAGGGGSGGRFRGGQRSASVSSTRRTDALYLESILRQQRREAKVREKYAEHTFQPNLSRGRSTYRRETFSGTTSSGTGGGDGDGGDSGNHQTQPPPRRSASVHERLYDASLKRRERNAETVNRLYSKSRVARNRRIAEFGHEGDKLDEHGDFLEDEWETKSEFSVASARTTHSSRTDALYLEAMLRKARREEKAKELPAEHTFQPFKATPNGSRRFSSGASSAGSYRSASSSSRRRASSVGASFSSSKQRAAQSENGASSVSRHELLYQDGERRRQRNLDAMNDPYSRGTGELIGEFNKHWASSKASSRFKHMLSGDRQRAASVGRRASTGGSGGLGDHLETRSLGDFSVGSKGGAKSTTSSGTSHTRRTEALYLEASLRAARKEAMREAYHENEGHTYRPLVKTGQWAADRSLTHVVSRLYDPAAQAEKEQAKQEAKVAHELRHFKGAPAFKPPPGGLKTVPTNENTWSRLHEDAAIRAQTILNKAASLHEQELEEKCPFAPVIQAKSAEALRKAHKKRPSWVPKVVGKAPTKPKETPLAAPSAAQARANAEAAEARAARTQLKAQGPLFDPRAVKKARDAAAARADADAATARDEKHAEYVAAPGSPGGPPRRLSALERFRARQAERASKRAEEISAHADGLLPPSASSPQGYGGGGGGGGGDDETAEPSAWEAAAAAEEDGGAASPVSKTQQLQEIRDRYRVSVDSTLSSRTPAAVDSPTNPLHVTSY